MDDNKFNPATSDDEPVSSSGSVEEFFSKLKPEMRRPKPSDEAVAVARQAIERLEMQSMGRNEIAGDGFSPQALGTCRICGFENPSQNKFCGACGGPLASAEGTGAASAVQAPAGKHHYHHHYHHHYLPGGADGIASLLSGGAASAKRESPRTVSPTPGAPASLTRSEANIRKLVQDWALACNTKKIDDLVEFYAQDALVMRSNQPTVRGTAAIREFFVAALDGGLGDIEMDPMRIAVTGDLAFEAGRCKMLVPMVVGKRREERGKYAVIFARQSNGEWQITVDCWSSDLGLKAEPEVPKAVASVPPKPIAKRP